MIANRLLNWLESQGRKRIVFDTVTQEPYLERYYVFLKDRQRFPFNIFLHKFLKSDPDDLHDHPWPYATFILKGGYWEWTAEFDSNGLKTREIKHWRGPGHLRFSKANSYHRVELEPNVTCWTLFMPGPQCREWGFLVNNRWIHNRSYLDSKNQSK